MNKISLYVYSLVAIFSIKTIIHPNVFTVLPILALLAYEGYRHFLVARSFVEVDQKTEDLRKEIYREKLQMELSEIRSFAAKKAVSSIRDTQEKRVVF